MNTKATLTRLAIGAGLMSMALALPVASAGQAKTSKAKGDKPAASAGWMVIEDDFWFPWRFEPMGWFHNAELHYRQKEEKAAASELRKAETWLNFAAGHALPITQKSLHDAAAALKTLADDLEKGRTASARSLDSALVKANHALAQWHYFMADEKLANDEEKDAALNLQAAARYLKQAADSAEYEYGDDFVTVYDDLFGWSVTEAVPNTLKKNLSVVKGELEKLSASLDKTAAAK